MKIEIQQNLGDVKYKSKKDVVTRADIASEKLIVEGLRKAFPEHSIRTEEAGVIEGSDPRYRWIIDPVDGTVNFSRGIPLWGISIALHFEGEPLVAVVNLPKLGELFTAVKGGGAFCNGVPIHVSDRPYEDGLLYTAMSTYHKEWARSCHDIIFDIYMDCNDVRRTGSAAVELCLLASGYADLYFELRLMPWDYAAAALILCEAGGSICSFDGAFPSLTVPSLVVAANRPESCRRILSVVHRHLKRLPYA